MPDVRSSYTDSVRFFSSTSPRSLIEKFGSVLYVYNEHILRKTCRELKALSTHPGFRVNYSTKANANPALLHIIREEGCFADAMSPGERLATKLAGYTPDEVLYICNNVSGDELREAVDAGHLVCVDSLSQLALIGSVNPGGEVMLRINPGTGAGHHKKVVTAGKETKFGITLAELGEAEAIIRLNNLRLRGISQHIGSLFMDHSAYLEAADTLLEIVGSLPEEQKKYIDLIDFGGGFGIPYHKHEGQARLDMAALGRGLNERFHSFSAAHSYAGCFLVEPGRYVVAECGLLLGTVHAVKNNGETRYVGTDLGFNQLMRPVLYDAFHDIEIYREAGVPDLHLIPQTVVGNICESGDILAKDRPLPEIKELDIIALLDAGAYGFSMASNYNMRVRPAEVLLEQDGKVRLIRRREQPEDLVRQLVL